ncbi:MAG: hypothetical protein RI955_1812, partial [Bacteroidota bacterium]
MKKKLILFIFLFYSLISKAQTFEQSLNSDKVQWKFYCTTPSPLGKAGMGLTPSSLERAGVKFSLSPLGRAGEGLPATVPGTIHLDLLDNKLIPDPFYADNEKHLQWIDTLDWVYETTFDVDSNLLKQQQIELQFDGLDTYADVYLNENHVSLNMNLEFTKYSSDNMFVKWICWTAKDYLKVKNNQLKIVFHSTIKESKKLKAAFEKEHGYSLPEGERVFVRKAQYQFGWDFAPRFLGCGIWRGVKLIGWNDVRITNVEFNTEKIFKHDSALVNLKVNLQFDVNRMERLQGADNCPRGISAYLLIHKSNGIDTIKLSHSTSEIEDEISTSIIFRKPKVWNCNGEGNQELDSIYLSYETSFIEADSKLRKVSAETKTLNLPIRTAEFIHEKDSIGESFYFKLN